MSATKQQCHRDGCSRLGSLRCSACKSVGYCEKECQRLDWPTHKTKCTEIKAKRWFDHMQQQVFIEKRIKEHDTAVEFLVDHAKELLQFIADNRGAIVPEVKKTRSDDVKQSPQQHSTASIRGGVLVSLVSTMRQQHGHLLHLLPPLTGTIVCRWFTLEKLASLKLDTVDTDRLSAACENDLVLVLPAGDVFVVVILRGFLSHFSTTVSTDMRIVNDTHVISLRSAMNAAVKIDAPQKI